MTERDELILKLLQSRGLMSVQSLCDELDASPATIRRDLERLESEGHLERVRGGARSLERTSVKLQGTPFELNLRRNLNQKAAIGKQAAALCEADEAIIIDGGTTTFQMCPHLNDRNLHVLTNSLHIVDALQRYRNVNLAVPGGSIFREQNIILSPFEDDGLKHFHASKMFIGAAGISAKGLMQADTILIQAERKLMARADKLIVLVDSSKFQNTAALVLCGLDKVDTVITDKGISPAALKMLQKAAVNVIIAK
ncbi:MAG TPA: DeoR/GlpR family DNA-binding transcription regulator [Spongiibacteraceae bacterium]|nr:DeoR/GlpR family DNA-binding transcription regulator [Spongiibacteraceae bacterium]